MLPEELKSALSKHKKWVFVYDWEFFSMRIHDELVISVLEDCQFLYVEMIFDVVQSELQKKNDRLKFWDAFFKLLSQKRYDDICGFLDNDRGLALVFTHSNSSDNNIAWTRFCECILSKTGFNMLKWDGINYAEYPPKEFFVSNNET
ncbi:MAG: hypothetical protein LBC85_07965 [Fibromonadaceae bacterium]|jgi:hypothetical protein|nr:hypothetical protein [Fibromonadaceae bacterium]